MVCFNHVILTVLLTVSLLAAEPQAPAKGSYEDYLTQSVNLIQAGRFEDAITAAKEALRKNPKSDLAWNNIAVADIRLHRLDDAGRCLNEALRLNPGFELAKGNLDWLKREQATVVQPAPLGPAAGTAEYFLDLSLWQYRGGRYQFCVDAANEAIKLKPDMAEAWNNVAACEEALGLLDQAIAAARKALALKPDFELAKNNLNSALAKKAAR
jgi:Flp pilus assembly protein TadD